VKRARQLLEDESLLHIKTETLGEMAGFGTRQSFTAIFEKTVGVTPSLYREQIRKEDPNVSIT
jgi:AraC-like DNA-binding protein